MVYPCPSCGIIAVSFRIELSWFGSIPHCGSLEYFAANCALCLCCMCNPPSTLLWNGVGVYLLFTSLIPSHLSLRSKSFDIDSSIMFGLSSFLFL
jgi:hypothetical protein